MPSTPLPQDIVDYATFEQLIEMDEDEPGFSQGLVDNFFEQAESTLQEIEASLQQKDLATLSRQGHFLKGSAAALGIIRVKLCFEKIQYLGQGKDEFGQGSSEPAAALARIAQLVADVHRHLAEARTAFNAFYAA
ncbi:Phosphorelay intermediate protein [Blastocladiella emersonii ATCC 22665]|nr:Phosphorelay intermediate protein [Blastocladiella emersonii ATCC 22665]